MCWSCLIIQILQAGGITVWFPEGESKQEAWFNAVRYGPVRESSRSLLVIPRGTLHSEKQWEALHFSLPEDFTAEFMNAHFDFLTACKTNYKLKKKKKKKDFLKNMSFGSLFQVQNASVIHLIACCNPDPASHRGHDEALEIRKEFCSERTSEELAQNSPFKGSPAISVLDSGRR